MNNAKQPPYVSVPLELIGGLYTEALPESLPLGASPLVINCDFILGSNLQRPGKQSVYTFSGFFIEKNAGFGQSVEGTAPNEAPWLTPDNIALDTPGTYASVILNGTVTTPAIVQAANGDATALHTFAETHSPAINNITIGVFIGPGLKVGNVLFIFPNFFLDNPGDPFPISGVTDNSGNTYVPLGSPEMVIVTGNAVWAQPFYCLVNADVSSLTITFTYVIPTGHVSSVTLYASSINGISTVDATFASTTGVGTAVVSPDFTTTNPSDLLIGFALSVNGTTVGAGFTSIVSNVAEYKAVVSTGTYNTPFTQLSSGEWAAWGGAFKSLPTLIIPFTNPVAAGNLIVVELFGVGLGTISVNDSQGNSYALAVSNVAIATQGFLYYTPLPVSAGALQVTVHWNGTNEIFGLIHEVSGVTFLDQTNSFAFLSATAVTTGNVTINQNELVIGGAWTTNTATVVAPGIAIQDIGGQYSSAYEVTTGPTVSLNWTQSVGEFVALIATFRAGVLTGDISEILEGLNFPFSIPSTQEVFGLQVQIGGHQSVIPADAILTVTLADGNGNVSPSMTTQLPLTTDGLVTLGLPSSTWGFTLTPDLINNPNFMVRIVASATGGEQASFDIYAVELIAWLSPNPPPSFNYIKTFAETGGEVLTLVLGSDGVFYQEDAINNPDVLTGVYEEIQPNSFAQSATVDDREFIAISNLQNGTDIPYTYNPPNFDRLSQVGPGAAPSAITSSSGSAILTITQYPAYTLVTGPHAFLLVSASPSDTGTFGAPATPGNVMTLIFPSATLLPLDGQPTTPFVVGANIFIKGFPTINGNIVNNDPSGATAPPYYTITSVGQPITGQQSYDALTFTVNFTTYFAEMTPAGCSIQLTIATMTTAVQVPNLEVGDQFEPTGTGGAPPAGYDGTWTVLTTPNASQMLITSTGLVGNVATYGFVLETGVNPVVGQAVTVTLTNNGNGIFNVTNAIISATSAGTFSVSLVSADITTAAENGAGIIFGTIFTFDAFAIIGNRSGGTVVTAGVIGVGPRQVCYSFLTRNGFLSQPSPIFKFNVVAGASNIAVAQLLTGPSNVIARVVHFTAANGDQFYNIPDPVSVIDNGVTVINTSTWVNDNITTNAIFSFSDGVLLAATEIDIEGDNLFECIELGSCVAIIPYAQRVAIIGEQNKIPNLLNYSFDGGVGVVRSAGGTTSTYPAGWTVDLTNGAGGSVVSSPIFGFAYVISNTTGSTQAIWGMITQNAFQDEFMVAIVQPSTTYSVRITAAVPTGIPAGGNLVIDLYSPSLGRSLGTFTLPLTSMATSMQIFTGTLLTTTLAPVPNDLLIRIYATQIPTGVEITMDRMEPFPTEAPNLNTQAILSYSQNFESFDRVTGIILATQQNQQPVVTAFTLFGTLYLVKTGSIVAVNDNNTTEPSQWTTPRVISNSVGGLGPYAVTTGVDEPNSGEEWSLIGARPGLFLFQGSQPVKLSEEIQAVWDQINFAFGYTVWVKNDVANRRILVGVPLKALNSQGQTPSWLPAGLLTDNNPSTPNVILEMNYKQLNTAGSVMDSPEIHRSYSGKIIASDIVRKWSIWTIKAPCAAFVQRLDNTAPLFLGNSDHTGKIYELINGLMEDDGAAINQIYYTAGFVPTEVGQGMQMGVERYNFDYMFLLINGSGAITMTVFPNNLTTPYAHTLLPDLTLPASTNGDNEIPVNECGSRLFIAFSSNAVGAGFALVRVIMICHMDPWSATRGVNT